MARFYFEADNQSGTAVQDFGQAYVDAASEDAARAELTSRGIIATYLEEVVE